MIRSSTLGNKFSPVTQDNKTMFRYGGLFDITNVKDENNNDVSRDEENSMPKGDVEYTFELTSIEPEYKEGITKKSSRTKRKRSNNNNNSNGDNNNKMLAKVFNAQSKKRKTGDWVPSGHTNGKWKEPDFSKRTKIKNIPKGQCKSVQKLIKKFSEEVSGTKVQEKVVEKQQDISCDTVIDVNMSSLQIAGKYLRQLLPKEDVEQQKMIDLTLSYHQYWKPDNTKIIILAESHAQSSLENINDVPELSRSVLSEKEYNGPVGHMGLVYCLTYGENEALTRPITPAKKNAGTTQFWKLFALCSRGIDFRPSNLDEKEDDDYAFSRDLMKSGGLSCGERIRAKLAILEDLKAKGIWLVDTSLFGWYIPQEQEYTQSDITGEVNKLTKARPPTKLKPSFLLYSWETITKHLIKAEAEKGKLKLLIPIGREVMGAVTRERMEMAIKGSPNAKVSMERPAPNAMMSKNDILQNFREWDKLIKENIN